jgi:hypothetical protein
MRTPIYTAALAIALSASAFSAYSGEVGHRFRREVGH